MGHKHTPHDNELYQRTDEVLHCVWDPIGVSGMPVARDEYNSYLPLVFAMLNEGADENHIAAFLTNVVAERMGLKVDPKRSLEVASILTDWRDTLRGRYVQAEGGAA